MKKKILILAATINQLPIILLAKNKGFFVITADYFSDNIGHNYADKFYISDITNKEAILQIAKKENIDGVIAAYTDVGVPTASFVADKLGLIAPNFDSCSTLTNKIYFRNFYKKNIKPSFFFLKIKDQNIPVLDFLTKKFIVKPIDSSGSKGITVVDRQIDVLKAIKEACKFSKSKTLIIEEFISGNQGTIEGFLEGKEIIFDFITDRLTVKEPNVATRGHVYPSSFSVKTKENLLRQLKDIFLKLKITDGPFNADFVVDENGETYIIEVSPRLGGNNLSKFIKTTTNVCLQSMTIDYALGVQRGEIQKNIFNKKKISLVIGVQKEGILFFDTKIVNKLKKEPFVLDLNIFKKEGDYVKPLTNGRESIGFAILEQDNKGNIEVLIKKFYTLLNLQVI